MKQHQLKPRQLRIIIIISLLIGLLLSILIFNYTENKKNNFLEITFIQPHQALIFWKTDHDTIGYIKTGTKKSNVTNRIEQTSSTPGEIHTVVVDGVPLEGIYITLHNESDSRFLWKKPLFITFDPSTIE
ncbi:MAG: hypothetical protein BroJett025_04450 [Patescibacteria group bacterium]|nr:MAG: hypothetical protein BroJett025_04450 [Patescibacteria group bacterium]